jgi:hypothetical protein
MIFRKESIDWKDDSINIRERRETGITKELWTDGTGGLKRLIK